MKLSLEAVLLVVFTCAAVGLALVLPLTVTHAGQSAEVFSGTVEDVKAAEGKITVKNELGRAVALELINPELLKGVTVGDHVSVELEKPGVARKITKLAVPELKGPLDSGK